MDPEGPDYAEADRVCLQKKRATVVRTHIRRRIFFVQKLGNGGLLAHISRTFIRQALLRGIGHRLAFTIKNHEEHI
jgi:hypothetical protein